MNNHIATTSPAGAENGSGVRKFSKARPLAARFGLHPKTIFRWADAGKIHRYKVNPRVVLFDEGEVLAYVEAARVG
jgi:hypothetical protein